MSTVRTAAASLLVTGAAATGLLLAGGPASADTAPSLILDHTTVAPGDAVTVTASCGDGEGVNLVGSEAFVPTGNDGPYTDSGGTVPFDQKYANGASGTTTIRSDVPSGTYRVSERCGGGVAATVQITVT